MEDEPRPKTFDEVFTSTENERVGDQNSAFVGPQNLVGYLFDGEIAVFIGENPPKIQIHASTDSTPF